MHNELSSILLPSYGPCPEFKGACTKMRWEPHAGHVPRGFCGATGDPEEVELILVFAEPGTPPREEKHTGIESVITYTFKCFEEGKDTFHNNVRKILDLCFPDCLDNFDAQMRRVWIMDSVLCSAKKSGGYVPVSVSDACIKRYLIKIIELFPNAKVIGLGKKTSRRLDRHDIKFYPACAATQPWYNTHKAEAEESWKNLADLVKSGNPAKFLNCDRAKRA